jgi:uncharacterized protein (DUF305 family)
MNNYKNTHVLCFGIIVGALCSTAYFTMSPYQDSETSAKTPTTMSHAMTGMTSGITGKTGDDFDKAFLAEMTVHHNGAVAMAQEVLKTSRRPELITLAQAIIAAQTTEIHQMQVWQKAWFGK